MTREILLHVRLSTVRESEFPPACLDCHATLDLHQPLPDRPKEMLGTCSDCGTWYYLKLDDDGALNVVAHLPLGELHPEPAPSAPRGRRQAMPRAHDRPSVNSAWL